MQQSKADYSGWHFAGLDKWAAQNGNNAGSCRDFVDKKLFEPLGIKEVKICLFNGRGTNLQSECGRMKRFIQEYGGITVAVVGLK